MLIFLHGQDSFRIHERIGVLRQGFQNKYDVVGYNVELLHSADVTSDQIRSTLLSAGLFSSKRFTVLQHVFNLKETVLPVFIDAIQNIDADSIVVCTAEQVPKKKSELKTLVLQADRVEEYTPLTDGQLRHWTQQRLKNLQATIAPDALAFTLHSVGNDLWTLHGILNQLAAYTSKITVSDARLFVQSPLDDNIFHLTDALSERNTQRALQLLHEQFAAGGHPFYIVSMLARQIRILIEVKESNGQLTSLHPYVAKKAQQHAQRFSIQQLQAMHHKLLTIDYILKSSSRDPQLLFDTFVVETTR